MIVGSNLLRFYDIMNKELVHDRWLQSEDTSKLALPHYAFMISFSISIIHLIVRYGG